MKDRAMAGQRSRFGKVLQAGALWSAVLVLLTGCGRGEAAAPAQYQVAEVERRNLQITAEATGQLEPLRKVEVKSRASGEVMEVMVETGDRVEPGTLLARVDPRDVQNDFEQAQADLDVAQERFAIAEAQLRRSENLLNAGVITEQEHESRNLEFANSRANLVRAQTTLDLARVRLNDVTIRAPMSGVVLERLVEEGTVIQSAAQNVSGGTTLITIANLDVMQVRTLVDETDVGRIEPGMAASVRVDAFQDRTFQGQVEKVEPMAEVQSNVVMFPVIVRLDNQESILKPGMSAEVTVLLAERENALTLPNNAIVSQNELAAAGSVLGVPESRLEVDRSVFQELMREVAQRRGEPAADPADEDGPEGLADLRQRIASGEISQEEARARMREAMAQEGGAGFGGPGAARTRAGGRQASDAGRPGFVFVRGADGQLIPRPILIGVNDWNNSEVLIGLDEGEQVALIGGAQLQARQQEQSAQMRARMGGRLPF
jgi:HlyD family secretion protein